MRRYRPALLSPFGRTVIAAAVTTIAVIALCGYAYRADSHCAARIACPVTQERANA